VVGEKDVIVRLTPRREDNTLTAVLRRTFKSLRELAAENQMEPPIQIRLVDADGRCLVTMEMTLDRDGWDGQSDGGELKSRTGIRFPWFVIAEDCNRRIMKIQLEFGSHSTHIN
jgi:hypothetical protein